MTAIILESRLRYELKILQENKKFSYKLDDNNQRIWYILFEGAENTLYEKEKFKLKFEFDEGYVIIYLYLIYLI